ncbi:MAG TPA: EamA family transporter RarD, partial [Vulgatibacter sp.]
MRYSHRMSTDGRWNPGIAPAIGAYLAWGLFPLYWRLLERVSPLEIVAHRVIWSFVLVALLVTWRRRWAQLLSALKNRRVLVAMLVSTSLITSNWLLFIWAVNSEHVTQASLGYYVNPLVNVILARIFLGERLRPLQLGAVALATVGVINLSLQEGGFPWVALTLAVSFGLYGLVRKVAPVESLEALTVETGLAAPAALAFVARLGLDGAPSFGGDAADTVFLVGAGVTTALPLLWFASGARKLRYTTMGILQYIAPTGQLACAVLVFGEKFTSAHAVTFALIWTAVILYAGDGLRAAA